MKQLEEISSTEEMVRPFARMTAQVITQEDQQRSGIDVQAANRSSVITWWVGKVRL